MYFREREREGGREGEQENETERERFSFGVPLIDAFVCIHLLTRTCPDLRSNPQPCSLDDVLTYWATWPGFKLLTEVKNNTQVVSVVKSCRKWNYFQVESEQLFQRNCTAHHTPWIFGMFKLGKIAFGLRQSSIVFPTTVFKANRKSDLLITKPDN